MKYFLSLIIAIALFIPLTANAQPLGRVNASADNLQVLENTANGTEYHNPRAETLKPWNFVAYLIGYMADKGVPLSAIYMILVLPVIATIVAFARQVIGIKAFGIYTPSIIAVSFLATGFTYGFVILLFTLIVATLIRIIGKNFRIAHLPKLAIVMTLVCFALFALFGFGAYFDKVGMMTLSVFPVLIMVLLTETFVTIQMERGTKEASLLILQTILLALFCYFIADWQAFKDLLLKYPELVFLTILINIIIGKWTGLRLFEYYRFRKVIDHVELAEKK